MSQAWPYPKGWFYEPDPRLMSDEAKESHRGFLFRRILEGDPWAQEELDRFRAASVVTITPMEAP